MNDEPDNSKVRPGVVVAWVIIGVFFFSWYVMVKSKYDSTILATIIASIVAIIVGALGAWWGASATRHATELSHRNNLELRQQERNEQIRGLVQGLYAELKIAQELYSIQFQEPLESLKPDDYVAYWPVGQDYFTIYNNSSGMVGLISDQEIRTAIINAYMLSKGLIDTHLHNNRLVAKFDDLYAGGIGYALAREQSLQVRAAREEAVEYAKVLKQNYEEAKKAVGEALHLIEQSDYFSNRQIASNQQMEQPLELE